MIFEVKGTQDWKKKLASWAGSLRGNEILLLSGPMGAGKTSFVSALVELLGGKTVASPTYALHHEYVLKDGKVVDHWDLYRVDDPGELEAAGFWDHLWQADGLFIVEWPERVGREDWPEERPRYELTFSIPANGEHRILEVRSADGLGGA